MKFRAVFKPILITGLILILLVIPGSFLLTRYIEKNIKNVSVDGLIIQTGDVRLSLLDAELIISDVNLTDKIYGYSVSVDRILIDGIHIFPLIMGNDIKLEAIKIRHAEFHVGPDITKLTNVTESGSKKYKIKMIRDFSLLNSRIIYADSANIDTVFCADMNVQFSNLKSDVSATRFDFKSFGFDKLDAGFYNVAYLVPGGKFSLSLDSFVVNTKKQNLAVKNLVIKSLYGEYELGPKTGKESDWYELEHFNIDMRGLNATHLFADSALFVHKTTVSDGDLLIAKDKRYPLEDRPDKVFPMQLFSELPYKICFDSLRICNVDIDYCELHEQSDTAGCITFHKLQADFDNFSNIDSTIDGPTRILAQASLMDDAVLYADIQFPNIAVNAENQCKGYLHNMDMTTFNQILKYQTPVTIEGGKIDTLRFGFTYNYDVSNGEMSFQYHGFDLKISKRDNILTRLLHTFKIPDLVLADHNQKNDRSFNKGEIHAERNKKRSIFNFWAKSVLSGMKSTLNLPQ